MINLLVQKPLNATHARIVCMLIVEFPQTRAMQNNLAPISDEQLCNTFGQNIRMRISRYIAKSEADSIFHLFRKGVAFSIPLIFILKQLGNFAD